MTAEVSGGGGGRGRSPVPERFLVYEKKLQRHVGQHGRAVHYPAPDGQVLLLQQPLPGHVASGAAGWLPAGCGVAETEEYRLHHTTAAG